MQNTPHRHQMKVWMNNMVCCLFGLRYKSLVRLLFTDVHDGIHDGIRINTQKWTSKNLTIIL